MVLAVQDTTEVDWTGPRPQGLTLGSPTHQGLMVHTTLAFTPERVPWACCARGVGAGPTLAPATRKQRPSRRRRVGSGCKIWRPEKPPQSHGVY